MKKIDLKSTSFATANFPKDLLLWNYYWLCIVYFHPGQTCSLEDEGASLVCTTLCSSDDDCSDVGIGLTCENGLCGLGSSDPR